MAANNITLIPFGPLSNCNLAICPLEWSVFRYRPNVPANATFMGLFILLLVIHLIQGVRYRSWAYMACMVAGCLLEVIGYGGRIMLYNNPFDFNAFLINLVPITVAPVFFCAAIYVQLTQFINRTDSSISRLNPRFITFIFIPCDIVSLVLQAAGGALSALAETNSALQVGVNVSKAGLIFQVVTLVVFISLSTDYLLALKRLHKKSGSKTEGIIRNMLVWLSGATVLILARCIFRIYELNGGYFAPAFRDQGTFIAFESVFMCIAVACLNLGHPGRALRTREAATETTYPVEQQEPK